MGPAPALCFSSLVPPASCPAAPRPVPLLTRHQGLLATATLTAPKPESSDHRPLRVDAWRPRLTSQNFVKHTRPRARPRGAGDPRARSSVSTRGCTRAAGGRTHSVRPWLRAAHTHRSGLLAGRVAGQRDEIFERVLRVEVRRVADGRVWEVGGGRLRQDGGRGEVQGGGRVWAPGDPCGGGAGRSPRALAGLLRWARPCPPHA